MLAEYYVLHTFFLVGAFTKGSCSAGFIPWIPTQKKLKNRSRVVLVVYIAGLTQKDAAETLQTVKKMNDPIFPCLSKTLLCLFFDLLGLCHARQDTLSLVHWTLHCIKVK